MIGTRFCDKLSVSAISATTTVVMHDPLDLSRARNLKLFLAVPAAASTSSDTLDVIVQDTQNGVTWNDRGRFALVLGNQNVTTPYTREMNLLQDCDLNTGEREYQSTGSQGGSDIPSGTVLNGTFWPPYRDAGGKHPNWRCRFVVTNNSGVASFTASVSIYGQDWNLA